MPRDTAPNSTADHPTLGSVAAARSRLFERGSAFQPVAREEVVGIDEIVERVDRLAVWLDSATLFSAHGARPEPGVLFEGPPGTGKTLLARYLASRTRALFVDVRELPRSGRDLTGWDVYDLFARARHVYRKHGRAVILFWDELEGDAADRVPPRPTRTKEVVAALLAELDGLRGKPEGVLLVGCTNYPRLIDDALLRPGRIGLRIPFGAPDTAGMRLLLEHELAGHAAEPSIDTGTLALLFAPNDTAAAAEEAVADAWRRAVERAILDGDRPLLTEADLLAALGDRLVGFAPGFLRLDEEGIHRVAVHETGHALAALVWGVPLKAVSARAGRSGLGQTLTTAGAARLPGLADLHAQVRIALAGLEAELAAGLPPGAGHGCDTRDATATALHLVESLGAGRSCGIFNPAATANRFRVPGAGVSQHLLARFDGDAAAIVARARRDVRHALRRIGGEPIATLARTLERRGLLAGPEFERAAVALIGDPTRYARAGYRRWR